VRCIYCEHNRTKVIEKRDSADLLVSRRRRECVACGKRFTTFERAQVSNVLVIKKNGGREAFCKDKIRDSIRKALKGRNISIGRCAEVAAEIELEILDMHISEISTKEIAKMVLERLEKVDDIAFVRYASYQYYLNDQKGFKLLKEKFNKKIHSGTESMPK